MKQPKQINSCSECIYDGYEMCLIGENARPIPNYPNIPSWCPLPDAKEEKQIAFTRQELHQIMIGGEAGYDAAPSYEKEHIDLVCYELNQAIIAKTRTDG